MPADLVLAANDTLQILHSTSALTTATDRDADCLTNPTAKDTDGDGTLDGVEARLGTDPLNPSDYFSPLTSQTPSG